MFTHLHPEFSRENTASHIRRESMISVWRAINLGRLVAFTGSGTSSVFGLPSWNELAQNYAICVNEQIQKVFAEFTEDKSNEHAARVKLDTLMTRIGPILDQINRLTCDVVPSLDRKNPQRYQIAFSKAFDDDVLTFFALCDEILDCLPHDAQEGLTRRYKARHAFGQTVRNSEAAVMRDKFGRILRMQGLPKPKPPKQNNVASEQNAGRFLESLKEVIEFTLEAKKPEQLKTDGLWSKIDELFGNFCETQTSFGSELEQNQPECERDIAKVLMSELGVSRFVTLNYDVQIERQILKDQRLAEHDEAEAFLDLCEVTETKRPHQKRLVIQSGVEKGAISATLDHNNIAEIVNFSAYSKRYARQVMHLHGRYDDPENLILTGEDYRALYEKKSVARDSFANAQRALFDGNDVLFVGVGMSEDEINRQLKRFMTTEKYGAEQSRRAFLLVEASCCEKCEVEKRCPTCEVKDEKRILDNFNKLGVSTLIYGGPKSRYLSAQWKKRANAFSWLSRDLNPSDSELGNHNIRRDALMTAITDLMKLIKSVDLRTAADVTGDGVDSVRLLTETELDFLKNLCLPEESASLGDCLPELASLLEALCSEFRARIRSRAACAELKQMKANSKKWWAAWNEQPFERRAIYHQASQEVSGEKGYLWVRHCPDVSFQDNLDPQKWHVLEKARKDVAEQVSTQRQRPVTDGGKRQLTIARFAVERGRGQGSLVRLLHRKEVQEYLFSDNNAYRAAFIAHLTFSMEFASVAKALTRFVARQVAELRMENNKTREMVCNSDGTIGKAITPILSKRPNSFDLRLQIRNIAKELAPKDREKLDVVYQKLKDLSEDRGSGLAQAEIEDVARHLFISRRETEPRLLEDDKFISFVDLKPEVERDHRLDMLEAVIKRYTAITKDQKTSERLFICLGGLDRLCDEDGDAHNPMHRALFRLLCGTHEHQELDPPFDILLLSGKPNAPICFLSESLSPDQAKALESHKYKAYSRHSKTNIFLKKWPRVERLPWADRVALTPGYFGQANFEEVLADDFAEGAVSAVVNSADEAARMFIGWANRGDASSLTLTSDSDRAVTGLHRVLWKNVGLTNMLFCCWRAALKSDLHLKINAFMADFEERFNRDEDNGVLSGIFHKYRELDKKQSDVEPVLSDLVMRHLVLFALPVEPSVLLGCPRIYRALLKSFDIYRNDPYAPLDLPTHNPEKPHLFDAVERSWMLGKLSGVLEQLSERGMLIRINCSLSPEQDCNDAEAFLHHRFALHGRVREYIAYRMQLNVFDQGDTNHHQISLFCDQPKDLPTPSALHFEMIKNILNDQRDAYRQTLELTYRHSRIGRVNRLAVWDPAREDSSTNGENQSKQAAIRLFEQVDPLHETLAPEHCGSLGQLHSVTQCIRASFSLVRSAFSVGSLSRMDTSPAIEEIVPPFEMYRGWLRAILNAATGVRVSNQELSGTLDGTLIPQMLEANERAKLGKLFDKGMEDLKASGDIPDASKKKELSEGLASLGIGPFDALETPSERSNSLNAGKDALGILEEAAKLGLEKRQKTSFARVRHPLYRDEIAWLFNERALTSLIQGRIFDAIPLFRKARNIMSHRITPKSDTKAFNAVERRVNLNYAIAMIERGRIRDARIILEDLARSSVSVPYSTPSRIEPHIHGYLALCDHLGGSFETARARYEKSLAKLASTQELRTIAIFKRHLADLYRSIGDIDLAENEIQLAINAASQAQQRDILHLAFASRAQIHLELKKTEEVSEILPQLKEYSERMGLYGHRADALMVEARLNVQKGDLGLAADSVSGSIALCTRYGLRLRKLSGLVTYGHIQYMRGQTEIAESILGHAKAEAEQIGYQLKASHASRIISQKGQMTAQRVRLYLPPGDHLTSA